MRRHSRCISEYLHAGLVVLHEGHLQAQAPRAPKASSPFPPRSYLKLFFTGLDLRTTSSPTNALFELGGLEAGIDDMQAHASERAVPRAACDMICQMASASPHDTTMGGGARVRGEACPHLPLRRFHGGALCA